MGEFFCKKHLTPRVMMNMNMLSEERYLRKLTREQYEEDRATLVSEVAYVLQTEVRHLYLDLNMIQESNLTDLEFNQRAPPSLVKEVRAAAEHALIHVFRIPVEKPEFEPMPEVKEIKEEIDDIDPHGIYSTNGYESSDEVEQAIYNLDNQLRKEDLSDSDPNDAADELSSDEEINEEVIQRCLDQSQVSSIVYTGNESDIQTEEEEIEDLLEDEVNEVISGNEPIAHVENWF